MSEHLADAAIVVLCLMNAAGLGRAFKNAYAMYWREREYEERQVKP